jgi:hypothetical protein
MTSSSSVADARLKCQRGQSRDNEARADNQRDQNLAEGRSAGEFQLSWIEVRTTCHRKGGRRYLGASPSTKSVQWIKDKVGELLVPRNVRPWAELHDFRAAGLRTSAMAADSEHTGPSTITAMTVSDTSLLDGTKCTNEVRDSFPMNGSSKTSAYFAYIARALRPPCASR